MFETDLDKTSTGGYFDWFWDKFFPVSIVKRPDYLIIQDRRIEGSILFPIIGVLGIWVVLSLIFSRFTDSILIFLFFGLFALLAVFFLLVAYSYFFSQTIIFYKNKDSYEIINKRLFNSETTNGNISDIKEIKLSLSYYTDDDGQKQLKSTSKLIPKDLILNDLRIQELERNTINNSYENTFRIVLAISKFLEIPYSEEEQDNF
jgi:hypothetical protein